MFQLEGETCAKTWNGEISCHTEGLANPAVGLSKREATAFIEINKKSYSGHIDSDRGLATVLIRRQRQWVFMRKGTGTVTSIGGRHFYWCR